MNLNNMPPLLSPFFVKTADTNLSARRIRIGVLQNIALLSLETLLWAFFISWPYNSLLLNSEYSLHFFQINPYIFICDAPKDLGPNRQQYARSQMIYSDTSNAQT
jgi:hypothetical protein